MLRRFAMVLGIVSFMFFSVGFASASYFTLVNVGVPTGFTSSQGYDINNNGDIVVQAGGTTTNAFLYSGGTWTNLGSLQSLYNNSSPRGITDGSNPKVLGGSVVATSSLNHAFLWSSSGGMSDLGTLGGSTKASWAIDMNDNGDIAGYSAPAGTGKNTHAFVIPSGGTMTDLGTFGGNSSYAYRINNNGQIAGKAHNSSGQYRAFRYDYSGGTGTMTNLGVLAGGSISEGYGIDAGGQVVGFSEIAGSVQHACLWKADNTAVDLGALSTAAGDIYANAESINTGGQIVGQSTVSSVSHAFLYSGGVMRDLNALINPSLGWTLQYAKGINDSGQIVGYGTVGGVTTAYLLTPALAGDADLNGAVNGADLNTVLSNYNQSGTTWWQGDFDGNGTVNGADLNTVLSNYNQSAGAAASVQSAVPEPCTPSLLALGTMGVVIYSWRKRK